MINNTNLAHWTRLQAKNLDAQFTNEMVNGLNCSPFEAEAIVEKVHEVYAPLMETSQGLKPGQIQIMAVDTSVTPNTPLSKAKQRLVTLTLDAGIEDIQVRKNESVPALRRKRLCRMCQEAFQQGAVLTLEDLARLFNCGVRTLVNDLKVLRQEGTLPPLRSLVRDMGRAITHRRLIVTLWLQGLEYSEIAQKTCHGVDSVANYVDKFKRCTALFSSGFDLHTVALMVKLSPALTREFQQLHSELDAVPHRLQELTDFLKKTESGAYAGGGADDSPTSTSKTLRLGPSAFSAILHRKLL
jgi:Protein of unknown function (DUF1670)